MSKLETDIVIVGGGPIGLTTSILLSLQSPPVPHILFERHAGTSIHPKALGINQRTVEIFRKIGLEEEIYSKGAPPSVAGRTGWYTSVGKGDTRGDGKDNGVDGRKIFDRDSWGGGVYEEEYRRNSPCRYVQFPQIRLEPVLLRRAREVAPDDGTVRFGTEVLDVQNEGEKVRVTFQPAKNENKEEVKEVHTKYVIAADGGKGMTEKLGVEWIGDKDLVDMVTVHFRCKNIESWHPDRRNLITWFTHPQRGGSTKTGLLYQVGPYDRPDKGDELVFACALTPTDPTRFDNDAMIERLRDTLKVKDLHVEVLTIGHWSINAICAERYRIDRCFLVGDAAHRIPPWGALGMNTGIQDANNLVWKLVLALKGGERFEGLLNSYDEERWPIGQRVGQSCLRNLLTHGLAMDAALGMSAEKSADENERAVVPFFDEAHPEHGEKKSLVEKASKTLDIEFKAPGTEIGWFYPSADFWKEGENNGHGGQLNENGEFDTEFYHPSTIPGHHVPHAWLEKGGKTVTVRDLVPYSKLLLLAGDQKWSKLEEYALIHVEIIGSEGWKDVDGTWAKYRGVSEDGAVLVRPDGIVAWRGEWSDMLPKSWMDIEKSILYCDHGEWRKGDLDAFSQ